MKKGVSLIYRLIDFFLVFTMLPLVICVIYIFDTSLLDIMSSLLRHNCMIDVQFFSLQKKNVKAHVICSSKFKVNLFIFQHTPDGNLGYPSSLIFHHIVLSHKFKNYCQSKFPINFEGVPTSTHMLGHRPFRGSQLESSNLVKFKSEMTYLLEILFIIQPHLASL